MKIAVTGASGFIGQRVLAACRRYGDIKAVGLTRGQVNQEAAGTDLAWRQTDYSVESLTKALKDTDAVIHLAAIRGTTGEIADYHPNEVMLEHLLKAMKEAGTKHIVFASSIAVYSDITQIPWKETDPLTPKTLYGISKAACEHLCAYYAKQFDLRFTIFRIAQVLGEGERRRGMMNVFMDQAAAGEVLRVQGESRAKRQYLYVEDLAEALVRAAVREGTSEVLNIGMQEAWTNLEIAQQVNEVFTNPAGIEYDDSKPETIEPSCMEIAKLETVLGIRPRSMKEALADLSRHREQV